MDLGLLALEDHWRFKLPRFADNPEAGLHRVDTGIAEDLFAPYPKTC